LPHPYPPLRGERSACGGWSASTAISEEPFGMALEGFPYPYHVMRFNDLVLRFLGDGH